MFYFQAPLFCVFKQVNLTIQKWPKETRKNHKNYFIYEFGLHILNKFFKLYKERGPSLICDLLVYNTGNEIQDMENEGEGRTETKKPKKAKTNKPKKVKIAKDYQIITTDYRESSPNETNIQPTSQGSEEKKYYEESD